MLLSEVTNTISSLDQLKKAIDTVLVGRHTRLHSFDVNNNSIFIEVEYEFPEHFVKAVDVSLAAVPFLKRTIVEKGDNWKEGYQFAASYDLILKTELNSNEIKKMKDFLHKKVKK